MNKDLPLDAISPADRLEFAQTFYDAANRVKRLGWCQRTDRSPSGQICAGKAIVDEAARHSMQPCGVVYAENVTVCGTQMLVAISFVDHFALTASDLFRAWVNASTIPDWNDVPKRTMEDVVEEMRSLGDYLKEGIGGAID